MKILKSLKDEKIQTYLFYILTPLLIVFIIKFFSFPKITWINDYVLIGGANFLSFIWIKDRVRFFKIHRQYFWTYAGVILMTVVLFPLAYILLGNYGIPVFFGVVLITVLMGTESGTAAAVTLSTIATIMGNYRFDLFALYIVSSAAGIYLVRYFNKRNDITKAAVYVSFISIVMFFLMTLHDGATLNLEDTNILIILLNPFISMFLALGVLPYVEYFSRIYSNIGLSELGGLSHPLLKELSMEAPGTYFHSVELANMCEMAASRIGANYMLARTGAYFHDIGKMKRPEFFTENQKDYNPHDAMSPMMNYLVITSHVKFGAEIAKKNRLPLLVEDAIKEHHGTRMVSFFYQKALSENLNVSPDDFRYPGPKPRTKESGIIMLADSCEAAFKSFRELNPSKIENMIEEIVNRVYNERQLDDSGLSLKDLDEIVQEFSKILSLRIKTRIAYPKGEGVEKVIRIAR
jgi:putative nucleotidyltransferase with HDIG domain